MKNIIPFTKYIKEKKEESFLIKKLSSFKTNEGIFSIYDIEDVKNRSKMFTVFEDKNGWIIRNSLVPDNLQKQGIASFFYKKMNNESIKKTGKPLRSTQSRILNDGTIVHELSQAGIVLWDSLVRSGYAIKIADKNYIFNK